MILSADTVKKAIECLAGGRIEREMVAHWARVLLPHEPGIEFNPPSERENIWKAIQFLARSDTSPETLNFSPSPPEKITVSIEEIRWAFQAFEEEMATRGSLFHSSMVLHIEQSLGTLEIESPEYEETILEAIEVLIHLETIEEGAYRYPRQRVLDFRHSYLIKTKEQEKVENCFKKATAPPYSGLEPKWNWALGGTTTFALLWLFWNFDPYSAMNMAGFVLAQAFCLYWIVIRKWGWRYLSVSLIGLWKGLILSFEPMFGVLMVALLPFSVLSVQMIRRNYRLDFCKLYGTCILSAVAGGVVLGIFTYTVSLWLSALIAAVPVMSYRATRKLSLIPMTSLLGGLTIFLIYSLFVFTHESGVNTKLDALTEKFEKEFVRFDLDLACSDIALCSNQIRKETLAAAQQNTQLIKEYVEKLERLPKTENVLETLDRYAKVLKVWETFTDVFEYLDAKSEYFYLNPNRTIAYDDSAIEEESMRRLTRFVEAQEAVQQ